MILEFHPVTADRWGDFEQLFECKGGPHNCWCMVWRTNENKITIPGKAGKKASIKNRKDFTTNFSNIRAMPLHYVTSCWQTAAKVVEIIGSMSGLQGQLKQERIGVLS